MDFIVTYGLLSKNQHGFVPRKSCVTNLIETLNRPLNRLIYKLKEGYGISEDLSNWIKDYYHLESSGWFEGR